MSLFCPSTRPFADTLGGRTEGGGGWPAAGTGSSSSRVPTGHGLSPAQSRLYPGPAQQRQRAPERSLSDEVYPLAHERARVPQALTEGHQGPRCLSSTSSAHAWGRTIQIDVRAPADPIEEVIKAEQRFFLACCCLSRHPDRLPSKMSGHKSTS